MKFDRLQMYERVKPFGIDSRANTLLYYNPQDRLLDVCVFPYAYMRTE